jgi:hypothetical protein
MSIELRIARGGRRESIIQDSSFASNDDGLRYEHAGCGRNQNTAQPPAL